MDDELEDNRFDRREVDDMDEYVGGDGDDADEAGKSKVVDVAWSTLGSTFSSSRPRLI